MTFAFSASRRRILPGWVVRAVRATWLSVLLLSAMPVSAYCLVDPLHRAPALIAEAERNPKAVLATATMRLAERPEPERAGWFWAATAIAQLLLDRPDLAAEAADHGLSAIAALPAASARAALQTIQASTSEDTPAALAGIARLQQIRRTVTPGSAADACLLLAIGTVQHAIDRPQDATRTIMTAYRMTAGPEREIEHAWVTMSMAAVLMRADDIDGALSVTREGIQLAKTHDLRITRANLLYERGVHLIENSDYRGAMAALSESARIADALQGPESAAYAAMGACEASLGLGRIAEARRLCEQSAGPLRKTTSAVKVSLLMARIAMAEGHPGEALRQANRALDGGAQTATSTVRTDALEVRARARYALGDVRGAYADLSVHLDQVRKSYAAILETQTAKLRARLNADRREAQNHALRYQLHKIADRDRNRSRIYFVAILIGAVIILALGYAIALGRRHRRRLADLADTDTLTDLLNRRALYRTAQHLAPGTALCIALLDLDGFKLLNDRHGHAAGDDALRLFATTARTCLRTGDIIGRWGGEEFLVLLPETDLATATAIVERIRTAVADIDLQLGTHDRLAFSAGVAMRSAPGVTLDMLVAEADGALYRAKSTGRNRTVVADAPADPVAPISIA